MRAILAVLAMLMPPLGAQGQSKEHVADPPPISILDAASDRCKGFVCDLFISYRPSITDDQRQHFERSLGLAIQLSPPQQCAYSSVDDLGKISGTINKECYEYSVPFNSVAAWGEILQGIDLIERFGFRQISISYGVPQPTLFRWATDSVHLSVHFDVVSAPSPQTSQAKGNLRAPATLTAIQKAVIDFLRGRYGVKASLSILRTEDNSLWVSIGKLKSEVLEHLQYWEELEFYLVFIPTTSELRLHLLLDGRYSPGIGSAEPPLGSFLEMQRVYPDQFSHYANALIEELKLYLEQKLL
jgi:hypothetical protein